MKAKILFFVFSLSLIFLSCSELKEDVLAPKAKIKLTYKDDIKPILDNHCIGCHNQNADFDLSTYFGIIQSGVAFPGDENSKIIRVTQPGGSMRKYLGADSAVKAEQIKKWVVEDSLALGDIKIHPSDWVDIKSENSHGKFLRKIGYNFDQCKQCHGKDYTGGVSKSSCYACHSSVGGPEACNTCHGSVANSAPPRDLNNNFSTTARGVGAHQSHVVEGKLTVAFDCIECHIKPVALKSPGHIDTTPGAEVIFQDSSLARHKSAGFNIGEFIVPNPIYDSGNLTCSNTYCHGYFRNGNMNNAPKWNVVDGSQAVCGSCHGLPPGGTHPKVSATSCATSCHNDVVELSSGVLKIKDKTKHINGKLNLYGYELDFSVEGLRRIVSR